MTVKAALEGRLSEEDEFLLAKGIATGYRACDEFMRNCMALGSFYPGMTHRGHLLGIFAQHGLDQIAAQSRAFFSSVRPNAIRNHFHSHFEFPSRVHVNALFTGRHAERRAKRAVYREQLALVNGDLFECEAPIPDLAPRSADEPVYVQLLHGGWETPVAIVLAIPDRNQRTYTLRPHILPLVPASSVDAESVSEKMLFKLKQNHNAEESSEQASGA